MKTHKMQLVTIISEPVLLERLQALLRDQGATGVTVTEVRGEGSKHAKASEVPGDKIKVECIVAPAVAESILEQVTREYFENYSTIVYVTEVTVMRIEKFSGGQGRSKA
jgi:nitrogen regulatory protein P-II 2